MSRVAERVGLERTHLYRKLKQLGVKPPAQRQLTRAGGSDRVRRYNAERNPIPRVFNLGGHYFDGNSTTNWPTPSVPWQWTRSRRRTPAIPACRWAWPRSRRSCGIITCASIRATPHWPDRDRFFLSNGHGSMLLYALLHLTGFDLPMREIERFRQLHSKTPGHPEHGITPGVETTTGPLGQGFANAVGMAIAERLLAAEFNRPGFDIVDHRHLRVHRRRLHDGRHLARSVLHWPGRWRSAS